MKKSISDILVIGIVALSAMACNSREDKLPVTRSIFIDEDAVYMQLGNFHQLTASGLLSSGDTVIVENKDISWVSKNPEVVSVIQGILKARKTGNCMIVADYGGQVDSSLVTVLDGESPTGVDAAFTTSNIYDLGHRCNKSSGGMQQFDIDKDGNVYYFQVGPYYQTWVTKVKPGVSGSESVESAMCFNYAGHTTGASIEDGPDGKTYVWLSTYANKYASSASYTSEYEQYWNMQIVGRMEYIPGETVRPDDPRIEFFYPGYYGGTINVAIDPEHDMIAFSQYMGNAEYKATGLTRRIVVYKLSEALSLPLSEVTLDKITWGGGAAPDAEKEFTPVVMAHDLRCLTPVANVGTGKGATENDICYYAWQGFDIYDSLIYFVEGTSTKSMGGSRAALTVFNLDGMVQGSRTFVRVVQNPAELRNFGITTTGAMESEGVKAWNGNLYLGFASSGFQGKSETRCNVFKYKLAK